ncbi:hypothetical protein CcCBS67573_g10422 [Chytriomyces confervae]|uniref:Jacalin-type lectin domain-containing protein n=1 Tax=Chytriomyces confervae TaxID=246404 RepID=A0A507CYD7_9FUNG|nr:hypothetical protein CcCBS67573_g10422 [Chytriomyces confervae]
MQGLHEAQVLSIVHGPTGSGGSPFDDLSAVPGGRTIEYIHRITGSSGLFWNTHALSLQFFYILDNGSEWTPGPRGDPANLQHAQLFDLTFHPTDDIASATVWNAYSHEIGRIVSGIEFHYTNKTRPGFKGKTVVGTVSPEFAANIVLPGRVVCSKGRAGMVLDGLQFYHLAGNCV